MQSGIGKIDRIVKLNDIDVSILRPYSRHTAAYPASWLLERKFWPTVSRIDDGERVCRDPRSTPTDSQNLIQLTGT
jgi:hypothetical protein